MTVNEPGGPKRYELRADEVPGLIEDLKAAWANRDKPAVETALSRLEPLAPEDSEATARFALSVRASERYVTPVNKYRPSVYDLEHATMEDEPLTFDGKGPRVIGEVVGIKAHGVPGQPGIGWYDEINGARQTYPLVPGAMLANTEADGQNGVDAEHLTFVPFVMMSDIQAVDLTRAQID